MIDICFSCNSAKTMSSVVLPTLDSVLLQQWLKKKRLRAGEGNDRGWDGWMASPNEWTWVWANSRKWWRTGMPGMLQSTGSQRVGDNWAHKQQTVKSVIEQLLSSELWAVSVHCFLEETHEIWWDPVSKTMILKLSLCNSQSHTHGKSQSSVSKPDDFKAWIPGFYRACIHSGKSPLNYNFQLKA